MQSPPPPLFFLTSESYLNTGVTNHTNEGFALFDFTALISNTCVYLLFFFKKAAAEKKRSV